MHSVCALHLIGSILSRLPVCRYYISSFWTLQLSVAHYFAHRWFADCSLNLKQIFIRQCATRFGEPCEIPKTRFRVIFGKSNVAVTRHSTTRNNAVGPPAEDMRRRHFCHKFGVFRDTGVRGLARGLATLPQGASKSL